MRQSTQHILMVRPAHFGFNTETAGNNSFQRNDSRWTQEEIQLKAVKEFDGLVEKLRNEGVNVIVVTDTDDPAKPDAIFPNNWVSFHENATAYTYPMYSSIRRHERRQSILDMLERKFELHAIFNLENFEDKGMYLEGTGSMILDRSQRIAYACLSQRTNAELMEKFCKLAGFKKHFFNAVDVKGQPIYHTNVMMALGESYVVICLDTVRNLTERANLIRSFAATDKEVIEITIEQMEAFAGNMLEVKGHQDQSILVMSEQAYLSLNTHQLHRLDQHVKILSHPVNTIETFGGGSVRCMMAEVFLPEKK